MKFSKDLDKLLDSIMEEFGIPGVDLAVWQGGKEVYRRMKGYADMETKEPITENTLYNLYSNTKVVAAVAALQLFEKGEFVLEDKLSRFFPEFKNMMVKMPDGSLKPAEKEITIRDLFRMTAGIGEGGEAEYKAIGQKFYMETNGECPLSLLPKYIAEAPLFFEPGEKFLYGICYEMLAALIEKISGLKFSDYLYEHIFKPLGMKNTAFTLERTESKALANQYWYRGKDKPLEVKGAKNCLLPPTMKESASGGLISSVDDFMKFQAALASGEKLLKRSTINLMRLNQLEGKQFEGYGYTNIGMGYGLGVRVIMDQAKLGSTVGFGPFGWGGASGSYGSIDPENDLCIFYMQHVFDTEDVRTHNRIRNVIYANI